MRHLILPILISISVIAYGQNDSAFIPTCPDGLLPIAEVQVNNTASNHDDYGSTDTYTICSVRLTNARDTLGNYYFPGGVPVEIRNPADRPRLVFSTSDSSEDLASLFATLPEDGSWFTFFLKGTRTDTTDKSAIIEIASAGTTCSDVVLAREALMIPSDSIPIPQIPDRSRVEIEVGSVSTLDDYLTWSPKLCRIRWVVDTPSVEITFNKKFKENSFFVTYASYVESPVTASDSDSTFVPPLTITLKNMQRTNRLRFADSTLEAGHTATNDTLNLELPADGSWVNFFVAGNFNNASLNDKDAVMDVIDSTSQLLLSREAVMVRIRKNANKLTTPERNRFLEALKKTDLSYNNYIDFVKTHGRDNTGAVGSQVALRQSHGGSAFLPWHRAFVLDLERLLQAADPSVTIPYWKFDANAPQVFKSNFMGINSSGNMVTLSATNPIVSWTLPGEDVPVGIQRRTPYSNKKHPKVATETATLGLGSPTFSFAAFKAMERSFHNPAHSKSGSVSWISTFPLAARDPLFFLLHSNVDHVWAKWQWMRDRYNTSDIITYDLQGSFYAPAPGVPPPSVSANRTFGQYADDTMWPWDNVTGGTAGSADERPQIAVLTPFPATLGNESTGKKPTVKSMIDYIGITNSSPGSDLGIGYDDFFPY
jgi:tyrosinase